jgi:hypothetical protein
LGLLPPPNVVNTIGIYYSSAFSQYSCYQFPPQPILPTNRCGINNYIYKLVECNESAGCVAAYIATHEDVATVGGDGVCQNQTTTGLQFCDKRRYSCQIVGGIDLNSVPPEDAFIEWFWAIFYSDGSSISHYITGKFTFCASATYILNTWTANFSATGNGYLNVAGFGIPMFNPSNHNSI